MPEQLYAVGDIHGRYDLLCAGLDAIERHAGEDPATIVFLGDYVDRGPESRAVVEALMAGPRKAGHGFVCLMGNHEDMLLSAAAAPDDRGALMLWLANGGGATLKSYGIDDNDPIIAAAVPAAHRDWMAGLPLLHEDDHRVYVHAGLMPGVPLAGQTRQSLLYIREPFLYAGNVFAKHVVHGHTPDFEGPQLLPWRTNLDTGAVFTGLLSIGVFDPERPGGPVDVLSVSADEG